jgi:hypothetical protein
MGVVDEVVGGVKFRREEVDVAQCHMSDIE